MLFKEIVDGRTHGRRTTDIEGSQKLTEHFVLRWAKNTPWKWTKECTEAFKKVKQLLKQTDVLAIYDPDKDLVLQVDSSKDGLGAALLQDGHPLEFASRSLKPAERNWAQIEKEALAVLYRLERFDQYTYGRPVIVENDHKPLETILKLELSL